MKNAKRAGPRWWAPLLAAVLLVPAAGCDDLLEVEDPDIVTPDQLEGPAAVPLVTRGVVGDFHEAVDDYVLYSGLFTDEFILAGTFPTRIDVDERVVLLDPDNGTLTADIWTSMNVSRASADRAAENFAASLGDPEFEEVEGELLEGIALAEFYGAYIRVMFSEMYCASVFSDPETFEFGSPVGSDARMQEAIELFQQAESSAQDAGRTDVATAARVGQARGLLWLGDYAGAAQLAETVPEDFVFVAEYSANQPSQNNEVHQLTYGVIAQLRWTVGDGTIARRHNELWPYFDEWEAQGLVVDDPAGFEAVEVGVDVNLQLLYDQQGRNIVLASGWEAQMIIAENELRSGQAQAAEDRVNALLADPGLNPMTVVNPSLTSERTVGGVTAPAMGAFQPVDFTGDLESDLAELARARAAGLWLTGERQGTLRRFITEDGLDLYPQGTQGDDIFFPIPQQEVDNNPNVSASCPSGV